MTIQEEATHPEVTDPGEFTAAWHAWHTGRDGVTVDLADGENW